MKYRRIRMKGGIVFEGQTSIELIREMRSIAINPQVSRMSDDQYMFWLQGMARSFEDCIIFKTGETPEERANCILKDMENHGLLSFLEPYQNFLQ